MNEDNNNTKNNIKEEEIVCKHMFDTFFFCATPYYQFEQYYRYGQYSSCDSERKDLYQCLKAKLLHFSDPIKAQKVYKSTKAMKRKTSLKNEIFEQKETPSW